MVKDSLALSCSPRHDQFAIHAGPGGRKISLKEPEQPWDEEGVRGIVPEKARPIVPDQVQL